MKFGNLIIQNFMSVKNTSVNLSDQGLTLIQGRNYDSQAFDSNGSGKSTVFCNAVSWVLFGETLNNLKADDIVNRISNKNTYVSLNIVDDQSNQYRIERYRKHKEHKNHVFVFFNNKDISAKSDTDTNALIQDIIQMDFMSFTNSIIFGQGLIKTFSNCSDAEQKKILERMLQIDIFKKCQDKAKEKVGKIVSDTNILEEKINSTKYSMSLIEAHIEDLIKKDTELRVQTEGKVKELESQKEEYQAELQTSLDNPPPNSVVLGDELASLRVKIQEYEDYVKYKNELTSEAKMLTKNIDITSKSMDKFLDEIEDIQNGGIVPKICETCGQSLPADDPDKIIKHIYNKFKQEMTKKDEYSKELVETEELITKLDILIEGMDEVKKNYDELHAKFLTINQEVKLWQAYQSSVKLQITSIEAQVSNLKKSLETTYTDIIEENRKKLNEETENLKKHEQEIVILKSKRGLYEFWVTGFGNSGIKSMLLDSVTPFLNQRANYYLSKLADSTMEVLFNTQVKLKSGETRDKFSVEVMNKFGDLTYKGNSSGEKRRIDLSVSLALQDLVASRSKNTINMVLYDEIFDNLDSTGCEKVIELLHEMSASKDSIFVISHNDILKNYFDRTLTVEKRNGETRLVS